jgi:hypothetical protein
MPDPANTHADLSPEATLLHLILEDGELGELFKAPPLPDEWLARRKNDQRQPGQLPEALPAPWLSRQLPSAQGAPLHERTYFQAPFSVHQSWMRIVQREFLQNFPKRTAFRELHP